MSPHEGWLAADGKKGLVSIVIPTCNRSGLLTETLESIFAQDYRPIQVVVVDDESTDDTTEVVNRLKAQTDEQLELVYIKQSKAGAPAARNRGANETNGEFIVFMDDDDIFNRRFLSAHMAEHQANPELDLTYCRWQRFMRSETEYLILKNKKGVPPGEAKSPWEAFLMGWTWLLQSCVIRREFVRKTGPWRLDLLKSQDLDYKARLAAGDCRIAEAREAAVFYRVHDRSISGKLNAAKLVSYTLALDDVERTAVARGDHVSLQKRLAEFLWEHSQWLYSYGCLEHALRVLRQSQRYDAMIGRRRGHSISRFMHKIGAGSMAGALLYRLFQLKGLVVGYPKPRVIKRLRTLPVRVDD